MTDWISFEIVGGMSTLRAGEYTSAPRCWGEHPLPSLTRPFFASLRIFFFFSREGNLYFTCGALVGGVQTAFAGSMGTVACSSFGKTHAGLFS